MKEYQAKSIKIVEEEVNLPDICPECSADIASNLGQEILIGMSTARDDDLNSDESYTFIDYPIVLAYFCAECDAILSPECEILTTSKE